MRNRPDNRTALDAFIANKAEIDTMLNRLQALSDEHFGYSPDDINWGHVGTPHALRRAAQAHHRRGLQGRRARRIAGRAPTSPRAVTAGGAWGSSRAAMVVGPSSCRGSSRSMPHFPILNSSF